MLPEDTFFKMFETFVPKRITDRDQKRIDVLVELQNKMLQFLQENPNFGKQAEFFQSLLKKYQESCTDLIELESKLKDLDVSKVLDFYEIEKNFPEKVNDIFEDVHIDRPQLMKLLSFNKIGDTLSIYSDRNSLAKAIKEKIYSKTAYVIKTSTGEYLLDEYSYPKYMATTQEKKYLSGDISLDLEWVTEECYFIAKPLGLTDNEDMVTFLKKIEKENPSFSREIMSAYRSVLTNMKRGQTIKNEYFHKEEIVKMGLGKMLNKNSGGLEDVYIFKRKI